MFLFSSSTGMSEASEWLLEQEFLQSYTIPIPPLEYSWGEPLSRMFEPMNGCPLFPNHPHLPDISLLWLHLWVHFEQECQHSCISVKGSTEGTSMGGTFTVRKVSTFYPYSHWFVFWVELNHFMDTTVIKFPCGNYYSIIIICQNIINSLH